MPHPRPIVFGLVGWMFLFCVATAFATPDLVTLSPQTLVPGEATPPAQPSPESGVILELPAHTPDRVFWDMALQRLDPAETSIAVELTCTNPSALRAITLHLQNGDAWQSASHALEGTERQTLYFHRTDFQTETGTPEWKKSSLLRISLWRNSDAVTTVVLHSIRLQTPSIAILRGTELTAPGETDLAEASAARALRLFEKAGVPATLVSDDISTLDIRRSTLLVLPYNPVLSKNQLDLLERFVNRGGHLAVFYQTNNRLALLLGFHVQPYATQSENWTTVSFNQSDVFGLPASMPHLTQHLLPVRAADTSSLVLGNWLTPDGIPDRSLPAAALSKKGFWFSHLPPLPSASAVQWLLASLAHLDSSQQPALKQFLTTTQQRDTQAASLLESTRAPTNEIHAVWALPIPTRLRKETLNSLSQQGIQTLFEQLVTLADNLPENKPLQTRLSRAITLAHANHIQLHAWIYALNAEPFAERIPSLRMTGRLMKEANGNTLNWLCPLHPENEKLLSSTLTTLAQLGVDGLHLDYIRYPGRNGCYCPLHRIAFEKQRGAPVPQWPADVLPNGPLAADYHDFLRSQLSDLLARLTQRLRTAHPAIRLSAAVYPTPASAAENAQDWPAWIRDGHLDFVSPMLYTTDSSRFASMLDLALAAAPSPSMILPGIGTGADESQLDALSTAQQIQVTRQKNTAGFALFQLDSDLTTRILPTLISPSAVP